MVVILDSVFDFREHEPVEGDEALVLTHPYHGIHRSVDPYEEFIRGHEDRFDVYFVEGTTAVEDGPATVNNYRVDLPSGYNDGIYEGVVREADGGYPGNIETVDAVDLLEEHDRVLVGGENFFMCVRRTYNDLVNARERSRNDTELGALEEVSYAPVTDLEGDEMMDNLRAMRQDEIPLYHSELTGVDFLGGDVKTFGISQGDDSDDQSREIASLGGF